MSSALPASIDPTQLAARGARLTGVLPLSGMPRLAQACLNATAEVHVDLSFERAPAGDLYEMFGVLSVGLRVACQRCLEGMDFELRAEPRLVLLQPGERQELLEQEGDILVAEKAVALSALVEDELLLAMPMVPMHELNQCPARDYVAGGAEFSEKTKEKGETRPNPFSALNKTR